MGDRLQVAHPEADALRDLARVLVQLEERRNHAREAVLRRLESLPGQVYRAARAAQKAQENRA
jgi:hypothetical protein